MTSEIVPLMRFSPSAQSPEILEAITVQRDHFVTELVDNALDAQGGLRHQLLIGPRGIGKTHILSLVANRISEDPRASRVVVAWLVEDQWGVRTYGKFLASIAIALGQDLDDPVLMQQAAALRARSDRDAELEGENLIRGTVEDRRIVLLVENLDAVFQRIGPDGQARFRAFLEDTSHILIFATSPQLFAGVKRHTSPFYGFFAVTHLDELTLESASELLRRVATLRGEQELVRFLGTDVASRRLAAVEALAGGHPRVWLLLAGCISVAAIDELVPLFLEAIDDLTPYYQDRLRELSDQQQEVVMLLCEAGGALSNRDLAERSGVAPNQIATMLRQLDERGYVRRAVLPDGSTVTDKRLSFWELREPLMRLTLDVKQSRGEPLRIVVEFLRAWYGAELLDELERIPVSAALANAYAAAALRDIEFQPEQLMQGQPAAIIARVDRGLALLPENAALRAARATGLLMEQRYDEAGPALDALIDVASNDTARLALRVQRHFIPSNQNDPTETALLLAEADALFAAERDSAPAAAVVAAAYTSCGQDEAAIAAWERAIEIDPNDGDYFRSLGHSLERIDRHVEALDAFARAAELKPATALDHAAQSDLLRKLGRTKEAVTEIEKAIAVDPTDAQYHRQRSALLAEAEENEEALRAIETAVELDPTSSWSHGFRAMLLVTQDRAEEGLASASRAVALRPDLPLNHLGRGVALYGLLRFDEAIEELLLAVELDPEALAYQAQLLTTMQQLGPSEHALVATERAIALTPSNTSFRLERAAMLGRLDRPTDALEALDEASRIAPPTVAQHQIRGTALAQLGRTEEALSAYDEALELDPTSAFSTFARVAPLQRLGRDDEAEQAARAAVSLDAENVRYRVGLAGVVLSRGGVTDGADILREALALARSQHVQMPQADTIAHVVLARYGDDPNRPALISQIVDIYREFDALEALGQGLLSTIRTFTAETVTQATADAWVDDWRPHRDAPELRIPLTLFDVARAWKRDHDGAHLLALPPEQREILIGLLPN